ncbi:MAG TPA: hypothetical protein VNT79_00205 [Phycisphaerae bacterium]|nr:hypothetical protein [Phycisphaerae bacterium]
MICPKTVKIQFDSPSLQISPQLTRASFLESEFGKVARTLVSNEPWHSWVLSETCHSRRAFNVALYFEGEKIASVSLDASDPAFGTSWDDFTPEKAMQQKAAHDEWVSAWLGGKRKFRWGTVWSGYDEKSGFSSIHIRYK